MFVFTGESTPVLMFTYTHTWEVRERPKHTRASCTDADAKRFFLSISNKKHTTPQCEAHEKFTKTAPFTFTHTHTHKHVWVSKKSLGRCEVFLMWRWMNGWREVNGECGWREWSGGGWRVEVDKWAVEVVRDSERSGKRDTGTLRKGTMMSHKEEL